MIERILGLREELVLSLGIGKRKEVVPEGQPHLVKTRRWSILVLPQDEAYLVLRGTPRLQLSGCYEVTIPTFLPQTDPTLWTLLVIYSLITEEMTLAQVLSGLYLMTLEELTTNLRGFIRLAYGLLCDEGWIDRRAEELVYYIDRIGEATRRDRRSDDFSSLMGRLIPVLHGYQFDLVKDFIITLWDDLIDRIVVD